MNDFSHNKEELNRELERFIQTLNEVLPRYSSLLKKTNVTKEELAELGEIEHFLIGMNYQISEIKERIEQDLFGHTLDTYYKLKRLAEFGDTEAQKKMERLRLVFEEYLRKGNIVNYN
ncbi:MAG: hypothetical protein EP305_10865 [Bacteroidetes bacterium]|jgi:hypothetical protein|nr:MAG: hypothetical protein EP305_10865 [Bacteroidota bacterium]